MRAMRNSRPILRGSSITQGILAAILVSSAALAGKGGQDEPPSLEDVNRGLATREARIRTLSAHIIYSDRSRNLRHGPFKTRAQMIDAAWTGQGRARADMVEEKETVPGGPPRRDRWIMSSDQAGTRMLTWGRKRDPREPDGLSREPVDKANGRIIKERGIFWAIPPSQLLNLGPFWAPAQLMEGARIESPRLENRNGRETIRVDWTADSANPPGSAMRGSFWIVPAMGFAVLRSERSRRPTPTSPWKLIEETTCEDFVQVGEVWLPRKATRSENRYWDDGEYEPGTRELQAVFADWKLNPEVDPATFRLDFPEGTRITDVARDLHYTRGTADDPDPKRK